MLHACVSDGAVDLDENLIDDGLLWLTADWDLGFFLG